MPTIGRELPAELGVQVDLVVGALEREPDGLVGWAAGQVVFKDDGYFLATSSPTRRQWCLHGPWQCPATVSDATVRRLQISAPAWTSISDGSSTSAATLSYWCSWTPARIEPPVWRRFGRPKFHARGAPNRCSAAPDSGAPGDSFWQTA